jgi:hypothetical protein
VPTNQLWEALSVAVQQPIEIGANRDHGGPDLAHA